LADQTIGPKVLEDPTALLTDRSADHLQEVAAFLAQTVMVEAAHSDAVGVRVARGASPVVVSLAAVVVGVAEVVDKIGAVKPKRGSIGPLFLYFFIFFLIKNRCHYRDEQDSSHHT
jgi:hypothetical protein